MLQRQTEEAETDTKAATSADKKRPTNEADMRGRGIGCSHHRAGQGRQQRAGPLVQMVGRLTNKAFPSRSYICILNMPAQLHCGGRIQGN
jgi:hypothetical protein